MKPIRNVLILTLVGLTALFVLADTLLPQPLTWFSFRTVFLQYSGIVAIAAMALAMLLALRPRRVEPALDGLDKMYRLHKWLGIVALVASVLHWWFAQGTKWMVGWGWLVRGARGARPDGPQPGAVEAWLGDQRGLAESLGEWAFYAAAVLIVLALVKRFPYHWFRKTHRWLSVAWLVLAWHAVVLTKFTYWSQPIGWLLAVLLVAGSVAAVLAFFGRIGARRRVAGTIESITHYPGLEVIESRVAMQAGWPGHAAGQFAFVTSDAREGPHPYTMASAWQPGSAGITFISKALGDHTRRLRDQLKVGMPVTVEGPYGCFDFDDSKPRQIWVGAGIGITPFVARMKQLAGGPHAAAIDLFHPTAVHEPAAIEKMTADARAAGVRLHLIVSGRDGRLDAERIRAAVPGWATASVWFCGPSGFGQSLRRDLLASGLAPADFHQELFEMR